MTSSVQLIPDSMDFNFSQSFQSASDNKFDGISYKAEGNTTESNFWTCYRSPEAKDR
jgi:hypothetical protein